MIPILSKENENSALVELLTGAATETVAGFGLTATIDELEMVGLSVSWAGGMAPNSALDDFDVVRLPNDNPVAAAVEAVADEAIPKLDKPV